MSIEVLETKIEMYGEIENAMDMLDNVTETELLLAELKYYDNPEVLSKVKTEIYKNAMNELDKLKNMLKEVRDA